MPGGPLGFMRLIRVGILQIDTLIDLALLDNRITNKKEAILGIIRGDLKYQKLIVNIYPKIAYNIGDRF